LSLPGNLVIPDWKILGQAAIDGPMCAVLQSQLRRSDRAAISASHDGHGGGGRRVLPYGPPDGGKGRYGRLVPAPERVHIVGLDDGASHVS
jgi:hypothetical protein